MQPYFPGYTFLDQFGPESRQQHLADLFRIPLERAKQLAIEPPLAVDYGYNIEFKGEFYCNVNCVFLDGAKITFGSRVVLAPGVHIYTGTHSIDVEERRGWYDRAYPVTVGDDVWIGGGAKILGGTVIGDGCTVAAGAVVKGTFPPNSVIAGVPARVIKTLPAPAPLNKETGEGIIKPDDERLRRPLNGMEGRTAVPLHGEK
ncbi:E1 ubiquitin-activating protein [Rhodotorula kratochvilovae]